MKVLLWKIGALGDVVMTTPLVRQMRARLPHAQIDYLVGRTSRVVLEGNPHLDQVLDFDEQVLLGANLGRLGEILALLRGYDQVFVLDKHWIFGWLAFLARVPTRIGFRRRAFEGWPHTRAVHYGALQRDIQDYLDLVEAAGLAVDRDDIAPQLPEGAPFDWPQPYVVAINSGGRNIGEDSSVRRLPDALFRALVAELARRTPVVFVGGPNERAYYEPLAAAHGATNLCGRTTLPQCWSVLKGAEAVYTTETGLMHMAAAVNDRVVAVCGPTHPLRKCPPGVHWVWRDEDKYDARYELFGRVPRLRYFETLTVADILAAGRFSAATDAAKTSVEAPGLRA
jgi:ADP-heptose:LPS heptosyltransferase